MKQCFVIMPFGGDDGARKKKFMGVYQGIIVPAVKSIGYEAKRSDISSQPGNITTAIIRDLAEAELVVADLTEANPNVFFELGIRHAFRKSGTVHIVDAAHTLPFDVKQYRTIEYTTELADIPDIIEEIKKAVTQREKYPNRTDNPVHDSMPELPSNITEAGTDALQQQLKSTQEDLIEIQRKNEHLSKILENVDPSAKVNEENDVDVDALLDQADEVMRLTGQNALLRLRQALDEGGADAFARELRIVLKNPYLDENDFQGIITICKEARLDDHRRATLAVARQRLPYSDAILIAYADALDDSPNPIDKKQGRLILEKWLGIQYRDGLPYVEGDANNVGSQQFESAVIVLFNAYISSKRYDCLLSLTENPPKNLEMSLLFKRNKALALSNMGQGIKAEEAFKEAIEQDPSNDTTIQFYANFLAAEGRHQDAYEQYEKSVIYDTDDPRLYVSLGIHILNTGYYRSDENSIAGPLSIKDRLKPATPLLVKAVELGNMMIREQVVGILVRSNALKYAQAIAEGTNLEGEFWQESLKYVVDPNNYEDFSR